MVLVLQLVLMYDFLSCLTKARAIITGGDVCRIFYFHQFTLLIVDHVPKLALNVFEVVCSFYAVFLMLVGYLLKFAESVAIQILNEGFRLLKLLHYLVASWDFDV